MFVHSTQSSAYLCHSSVPNFMCQGKLHKHRLHAVTEVFEGGDFLKGDGTGSFSIYGDKFPVSRLLPVELQFLSINIGRELSREAYRPRSVIDGKLHDSIARRSDSHYCTG